MKERKKRRTSREPKIDPKLLSEEKKKVLKVKEKWLK
jgi:hypothetical protein